MTNLDKLEDLLRKGEKKKAYELIKEDRGISAEILINEGIYFGTVKEHSLSISYLELAKRIAEDDKIKEKALGNLAVSYYNRGLAYHELNKHEEAIEDYSKAIELNPKDAKAYNNRGNAYREINQYKEAIEDCSKAIELDPNLAPPYNNRGNAYCEINQYKEAIEDYSKAIELNPNFALPYNNRGNAYREINQYEEAIEDYNKAIELNPNLVEAYSIRGDASHEINQYEEAIKDYNKAIELNPKDAKTYNNRGSAYSGLKQYKEAIKDYNKAIELNPNFALSYYNRGNAYREINQYEGAIKDYNKAIELNPKDAGAYNNRGNVYCKLNLHEEAIKDYNKAIELNPNHVEAYNNRGNAHREINQYKEAIEDCSKAIELNPNLAEAYNNRGLTYYELNQYEKAIKDYNKAIELNPNLAAGYHNRGLTYYALNQHEKAIEDYSIAINLNPKYTKAYNNRGIAHFKLNQREEAIKDYNKAIELEPNLAEIYANRGFTHLQINEDLDRAIEDFKHARDLLEGKDKDRMIGFIEWANARKKMNMKHWDAFRERMNEAKEIFEKIRNPLSLSLDAFIKFSFLDEELDNALNIPEPIEALKEIEGALKNPPEIKGLIDPERTIFGARILSFAILHDFISSMRDIDENTNLEVVKAKLTELFGVSKEVEEAFESVNFHKGKTTIVDIQDIISSVKQGIGKIDGSPNKKQRALEILKTYWSRLSSAIKVMNGISTRETESFILGREIREMKSELQVGFAETREIISKGFEKSSEEHKEIFEKICETENILLQKDVVNARYRIEIKTPLIDTFSPISPKIIIDIPIGKLTEEQIEEKAEEITNKIKSLSGRVKEQFLEAIKQIPVIGDKLLKRLMRIL